MKILVISPQPWDHILISKHNYAITLASRGHQVVFLNPPRDHLTSAAVLTDVEGIPGLRVLSYRRPWFYKLRFHWPVLFDRLMQRFIVKQLKKYDCCPDLVWCFDFNLFSQLSFFGAKQKLFHPVDPLSDDRHLLAAKSADLVLTVSSRIADQLSVIGSKVHVINHGLAVPFKDLALERLAELATSSANQITNGTEMHVGYAGNLCRLPVNRKILQQIIEQNPEVQFHFWGPSKAEDGIGADFVAFLNLQKNATLYGAVSQADLAAAYRKMDAFLLSYVAEPKESDLSNSHKILEYLSTGKVVISSRIQAYESYCDLLVMPKAQVDDDLPELFHDAMARLSELNAPVHQKARISLALDNTYDRQVDRIFELLEAAKSS